MTIYKTHDNGGRPFAVKVIGKHVTVTYIDDDTHKGKGKGIPCFNIEAKKVFVGKSPLNPMTEFSGGYGPAFDGNSFLLQFDSGRYIYVGDSVYGFKTKNEIIEFVSPVGNSDVPYPYAVDNKGAIYLLTDGVILRAGRHPTARTTPLHEPYSYYDELALISADESYIPPRIPNTMFEGITKFYIGSNKYTFRYKPQGGKDYDDVSRRIKGDMSIIKDGHKLKIGREDYAGIMKRFGHKLGFSKMTKRVFIARETPCSSSSSSRGISRLMKFIKH